MQLFDLSADPTADVAGWDARSKAVVLAALCFGACGDESALFTQGIQGILRYRWKSPIACGAVIDHRPLPNREDFDMLHARASTLRLAAMLEPDGHGGVAIVISPTVFQHTHQLATTSGVENIVQVCIRPWTSSRHWEVMTTLAISLCAQFQITGTRFGVVSFRGPGAGRFPTALSVISDLILLAQSSMPFDASDPFPRYSAHLRTGSTPPSIHSTLDCPFYIRVSGLPSLSDTCAHLEHRAAALGIVVKSCEFSPAAATSAPATAVAFWTEPTSLHTLRGLVAEVCEHSPAALVFFSPVVLNAK